MPPSNASHVPAGLYLASRIVSSTTGIWKSLGNLESRVLGAELDETAIEKPVFISGLARSGSTILTEVISQHPQTTCHRYSDFPMTWAPYWWNSLRNRLPLPKHQPRERTHRDRLMITPDSPEAIDEVLWMHFFPEAHRPGHSHVLTSQDNHPEFEAFYRDHLRKLLLVRKRHRFVAKNNYHITRLEYLLKLFPDARFIVPIRSPLQHVASLIKQHRLFCELNADDPRVSRQLRMSGHYEFGPHRCPIVVHRARGFDYGEAGDDVAWYASQWADIYGFLDERMQANPALGNACLVVRYEDLCSDATRVLGRVFSHLALDDSACDAIVDDVAPTISAPDYYKPDFDTPEAASVRRITAGTAERFGYPA